MPAFVQNQLIVKGPSGTIRKFKKNAVGYAAWGKSSKKRNRSVLNFHSLVPIPKDILKQPYDKAGYDWELKNWGCKWGSIEAKLLEQSSNCLLYRFTTPWSPPSRLLEKLGALWPDLTFVIDYVMEEQELLPFERVTEKISMRAKNNKKLLESFFGDIDDDVKLERGIIKVQASQRLYFSFDM